MSSSRSKPVVFFHVMKCGGTSVRQGLALGVAGRRQGPQIFELDGQAAIEAVGGSHAANWEFRDSLLGYALLAMNPSIVLGHFRYRDRHAGFMEAAHFVTVLRDPVERFVSLYKYRRHKAGVHVPVEGSFDEFLETPRFRAEGHLLVDLFCGREGLDPRSEEAVDAAVANLQRFAVVGFVDALDEFAEQVGTRVGKRVKIARLNASPAPLGDDPGITPELLMRAREVCAPDQKVFEQVSSASTQGDGVKRRPGQEAPAKVIGSFGRGWRPARKRTSSRSVVADSAPVHRSYDGPEDSFETSCALCGADVVLRRDRLSISESYSCPTCRAKLRYQGQARVLVDRFSRDGAQSVAALVKEPDFRSLRIWEPGELGPFRRHLRGLPNYEASSYWPDALPGEIRDGVRCEDMMALTFPTDSIDLVITSDIFEHVRLPYVGFAEVHRVLRPGGAHVFSIPVRWPMRERTVERVDTSGDDDVFLVEPTYHAGHLVYNDFGHDLLDRLQEIGFETEPVVFSSPSPAASQLVTFCSVKPQRPR